jgi:AraC family transcriptional regulator
MRAGHFPGVGRIEHLHTDSDAVLVWSGGRTEVTIHSSLESQSRTSTHRFVRHGGMVDLLPRGTTLHDVEWSGDSGSCVSVNLTGSVLEQLFASHQMGLCLDSGPRFNVTDAHVVDLVRRLFVQVTLGEPLGQAYAQSLSLTLASYVCGNYGGRMTPVEIGNGLPRIELEKLVAFVEEHLSIDLGLVELAALSGYSPDHFARLFKKSLGVSPHQFLVSRRVERAKTMLRDARHSLVEVAHACGFSSQAHFSGVFKQRTGVTPGVYRRG